MKGLDIDNFRYSLAQCLTADLEDDTLIDWC